METIIPWLLFAHVLGAIVAFGATFSTMPILGAMGGREPMHGNFALRVGKAISDRVIIPFAFLQGATGLGLIWALGLDLLNTRWLLVSIGLYVVALGYALLIQTPAARRMIELTSGGPPPSEPPPAGRPAGPPPEIAALGAKLRRGGMILAALIFVIVLLMVVKPF
jgi:hypothetical protein